MGGKHIRGMARRGAGAGGGGRRWAYTGRPCRGGAAAVAAAALLSSCVGDEPPALLFVPDTPHERYEFAFRQIGLEGTALGYRWIRASRDALRGALPVTTPYREVGYFEPNEAPSLGYRLALTRGEEVVVQVDLQGEPALVFIDLFLSQEDTTQPGALQASADSGATRLEHVAGRTGEYVVRLQPELLAGGRYEVTILKRASLFFPVAGFDTRAIRSRFGAARDGGRREHHGVDIFAPRGTPVIAAAEGYVRSTRGNRLGGKVVWLRTEFGSLYYAHLDSVAVAARRQVRIGDTLGFVGNTGNARTTPPHLHFGIYARRPTDPFPYVFQPPSDPPRLLADASLVGSMVRAAQDQLDVVDTPDGRSDLVREVAEHTPMRVLGGTGRWYRVALPDRVTGFVRASSVEAVERPLSRRMLARREEMLDQPHGQALVKATLQPGLEYVVLGRFEDFLLVESNGRSGWIAGNLPAATEATAVAAGPEEGPQGDAD